MEQRKNGAGSDRMTGVGQLLFDRIRFAGRKMYQPMIFGNSEAEGCTVTIFMEENEMRLDKFLKVSRLIKRRTVANEACDAGRVFLNEKPAKASAAVKEGDVLEIHFGTKSVKVEILDVQETVKKDEAKELYRYL